MEFKFHYILALLSMALVASHAGLTGEDYWTSVLPNSPMPKSLKDLLQTAAPERAKQLTLGSIQVHSPFFYRSYARHAAAETQLHDDPNAALFFLEKDLRLGKNINLQFSNATNTPAFLPRQVADSIPFSSNKLPEILEKFSTKLGSEEAAVIKQTIGECEEKGIEGEEKFCATSLESMVDFSTSKLGKDVEVISTNTEKGKKEEYRIVGVKRAASKKPVVVCHRQEYAYAVFYCHKIDTTVAYKLAMVTADGSKVVAVALCHRDTAAWNPKHLAFQVLQVKPGAVPVCHFLPEDHVVWIPKY